MDRHTDRRNLIIYIYIYIYRLLLLLLLLLLVVVLLILLLSLLLLLLLLLLSLSLIIIIIVVVVVIIIIIYSSTYNVQVLSSAAIKAEPSVGGELTRGPLPFLSFLYKVRSTHCQLATVTLSHNECWPAADEVACPDL